METGHFGRLFPDDALPPFTEFGSIPRLFREVIVTEKIDGTNAQVYVTEFGQVFAGSRSRWIEPESDNFGFARWVRDHAQELVKLGPGHHYGEWWGSGIQRGYGCAPGERYFSLFNTSRWWDDRNVTYGVIGRDVPPSCCRVVPVLLFGEFDSTNIRLALAGLKLQGSAAKPGFMQPEGIVAYHVKADQFFKATLDKNDGHKGG